MEGCTPTTPGTTHTITAASGEGGYIDPEGEVTVGEGDNQTFTVISNERYQIEDVQVDDMSVGSVPL